MAVLSTRRLNAIIEALNFRLAGEIERDDDPTTPRDGDYDGALAWAVDQMRRREDRRKGGGK